MRIDVHPDNDSGGFSLLAAGAVPAMVADRRQDDEAFVRADRAMLFSLVGDDPVRARVVVDEAPRHEEVACVLNRIHGVLDLRDGPLLVCGGFDPRNLEDWQRNGTDPFVASIPVEAGWYSVQVGATLGSINGQALAAGGEEAWLESDDPPQGPAPGFGWLIVLTRLAAEAVSSAPRTVPDEGGWFGVEAGRPRAD